MTTLYWILATIITLIVIAFIIASYIFHTIEDEEEFDDDYYKTHCEGKE